MPRKAGVYRYDVMERAAGAAQVIVVVGVDHWLVVHGGMDGSGAALFYAEGVVQHLDHRYGQLVVQEPAATITSCGLRSPSLMP